MKGGAHRRNWCLGRASDGFGLHIKEANDLSQYSRGTPGGKVNEYSDVLHETAQELLKRAGQGKFHKMKVADMRKELSARGAPAPKLKEDELRARLNELEPPAPPTLDDLAALIEAASEEEMVKVVKTHRSAHGVEGYACGLADNPRALCDALQYVRDNYGYDGASARYFHILLQLDRKVCKHSLLKRCEPGLLPALLDHPELAATTKGYSLDDGPHGALAIFHTLKVCSPSRGG